MPPGPAYADPASEPGDPVPASDWMSAADWEAWCDATAVDDEPPAPDDELIGGVAAAMSLVKAHRTHLYQRLISTGLSHPQVSLIYLALATLGLPAGVCAATGALPAAFVLGAFVAGAAAVLWRAVVRREAAVRASWLRWAGMWGCRGGSATDPGADAARARPSAARRKMRRGAGGGEAEQTYTAGILARISADA